MQALIQRGIGRLALAVAVTAIAAAPAKAQAVTPIPQLDAARFTGSWYEIARYPNRGEKHCAADVILLITRGDNPRQFQLVGSCTVAASRKVPQPYTQDFNGLLQNPAKTTIFTGRFKRRTIFPFSQPYWVLAVGQDVTTTVIASPTSYRAALSLPSQISATPAPAADDASPKPPPTVVKPNYAWLLIGAPNRKSLWIYAPTPTLPAATLSQIEARASAMGFDTAKLQITSQTPRAASIPVAVQ